jgi:hypothetical protein
MLNYISEVQRIIYYFNLFAYQKKEYDIDRLYKNNPCRILTIF